MKIYPSQILLNEDIAITANPETDCPDEILNQQVLVLVKYFNFNSEEHEGQIIINKNCADDILEIFDLIYKLKFPLEKVIPIAAYNYDDIASCNDNNCSGFNYRNVAGTSVLSKHATGEAFDINPLLNPYIKYNELGTEIYHEPTNASYDIDKSGTLYLEHPIVRKFEELGWEWGGIWPSQGFKVVDYQHFEKIKY